uniref:lysM and putative peptidoglycan-binding domain-containing protein 1-like n=1 Tax=Styela clava TaxID=7725 RepID=UPI0019395DA7|nr:lysM and putative peptidoglycan-binding domain-containing protein 1-like [Styela clava]
MTEWQSIVSTGVIQNSYGSFVRSGRKPAEPLFQHYVDPGETLPGIALRYGTSTEELRRINKLHYTDSIQSRQYLLIPGQKNGDSSQNSAVNNAKSESPKFLLKKGKNSAENESNSSPQKPTVAEDSVHDFLQKLDKQINSTMKVTSTMLSEKNDIEIRKNTHTPCAKFMRRKPSFESATKTTFSNSNSFHQDTDELFQL